MMRMTIIVAAAFAVAAPAMAESPFDGTWRIDVASAKLSKKPDTWAIKDGVYSCSTCIPAVKTMADGKVHAVPGHDYFDAMSVTVVDPTKIHYVYMRDGKVVTDATDTVGADAATLTSEWSTTDNAKGETVTGKGVMKRTAAGPVGAHATSGSWVRTTDVQLSDKVLTIMLKLNGDTLTMTQPTGETYTATLGGPKVPLKGDPAGTMVEIKKVGTAIVETDYRKGKPVNRFTMMPMPGGAMHFISTDLKANTTSEFDGTRV